MTGLHAGVSAPTRSLWRDVTPSTRADLDPVAPLTAAPPNRVSLVVPPDHEAATPRQREVTTTATEGAIANFGLGHLDPRIRVIGGVVFLDCNENGIQDQNIELDERPSSSAFRVRLERIDGSNSRSPSSTSNNRYSFDDLDSGAYVVTLSIQSSNFKATTSTRREITIGTTSGAVADFGLIDVRDTSDCTEAAQATATAVASGGRVVTGPNGQPLPPAAATAAAVAAMSTAQRFTPTPATPEYPFGLPVHPLLVLFWLVLGILLVVILVRSLR